MPRIRFAPDRRPRRLLLALTVGLLVIVLGVGAEYTALSQRLVRVPVAMPTSSTGGETWVIVGLDDRSKVSNGSATDVGATRPGAPTGARADIIVVVHVENGHTTAMTVSRDLLVKDPQHNPQRLGMLWLLSPQVFVDGLCTYLKVPATHLVAVNLRAFTTIVDTLGGIEMTIPEPIVDHGAGLKVQAGRQHVDGRTALALVRSRQGWVKQDGSWVKDPEGAAGRQRRAGEVLRAVVAKAKASDPVTLHRVAWHAFPDVTVDDHTSLASLAALRSVPVLTELPVDQAPGAALATTNDRTFPAIAAAGFAGDCTPSR